MTWQSIETAPQDGSVVRVKRVHEGHDVVIGDAVFDYLHENAPSRTGLGDDPLGRLTPADYAREDEARRAFVAKKRWLRPDRMYCFPTPTHWLPRAPLNDQQRGKDAV